jgi:hypothetical protein
MSGYELPSMQMNSLGRFFASLTDPRTSYRASLLSVMLAYFFGYGWFLIHTDFLPYVLDNNESFSAFVHGSNMYHFGFDASKGITDEAYGPNPAAHPYVYTHQGNFPRVFTFLLYAAGLHSIESHIAVSTFTVGALTIFMAFGFFARIVSPLFAAIACCVLMSDYILFAQWQVSTFKAWHAFFVFASLHCVFGFEGRRTALWIALSILNFACIFYFDLMMAVFTSALAFAFAVYLYARTSMRKLLVCAAASATGAVAGLGILFLQLVSYYGWSTFKQDFYLTFMARNATKVAGFDAKVLEDFFAQHRIVFWFDLADGSSLRNAKLIFMQVFQLGFGVYTPYLAYLAIALAGGWLLYLARDTINSLLSRRLGAVPQWLAWMFTSAGAGLLVAVILRTSRIEGVYAAVPSGIVAIPVLKMVAAAMVVSACALAAAWLFRHRRLPGDGNALSPSVSAVPVAGAILFALAALVWVFPRLFIETHAPLWHFVLAPWQHAGLPRMAAIAALFLALCPYWFIPNQPRIETNILPKGIAVYFVCILFAYVMAYLVMPGYITSNMQRYSPVLVFFTAPVIALAVYLLVMLATAAADSVAAPKMTGGARTRGWAVAACAMLCLTFIVAYWLNLQRSYFRLLPPTVAAFHKKLAKAPYQGKSFVSGNYAAPVAVMTGQWAVHDLTFIYTADYVVDKDGYRMRGNGRDGNSLFIWFADRDTGRYRYPEYALCFIGPSFQDALQRIELLRKMGLAAAQLPELENPAGNVASKATAMFAPERTGCRSHNIPYFAETGARDGLRHELLEQDAGLLNKWAIVRLANAFPPYLLPVSGQAGRFVGLTMTIRDGKPVLQVAYRYRQQSGDIEQGSTMVVETLPAGVSEKHLPTILYRGPALAEFSLPGDARGSVRVAVTPRSTVLAGRQEVSDWISMIPPPARNANAK